MKYYFEKDHNDLFRCDPRSLSRVCLSLISKWRHYIFCFLLTVVSSTAALHPLNARKSYLQYFIYNKSAVITFMLWRKTYTSAKFSSVSATVWSKRSPSLPINELKIGPITSLTSSSFVEMYSSKSNLFRISSTSLSSSFALELPLGQWLTMHLLHWGLLKDLRPWQSCEQCWRRHSFLPLKQAL